MGLPYLRGRLPETWWPSYEYRCLSCSFISESLFVKWGSGSVPISGSSKKLLYSKGGFTREGRATGAPQRQISSSTLDKVCSGSSLKASFMQPASKEGRVQLRVTFGLDFLPCVSSTEKKGSWKCTFIELPVCLALLPTCHFWSL